MVINDDDFFKKIKQFILWETFNKKKGAYVAFGKYTLTEKQSYFLSRVCAELALRHIGAKTKYNDNVRENIDEIIKQQEQIINGY